MTNKRPSETPTLMIYEDEEYVKTNLVSHQATIYSRVTWRDGKHGQEMNIVYTGYLTADDFQDITNIMGIRIEDGRALKHQMFYQ